MKYSEKFLYYTRLAAIARRLSCPNCASKWENKATDLHYLALIPLGNRYCYVDPTNLTKEH